MPATTSFSQKVIPVILCLHKGHFCKTVFPAIISSSSNFNVKSSSVVNTCATISANTVCHKRCFTHVSAISSSQKFPTFCLNGVSLDGVLSSHLRLCFHPRLIHSSNVVVNGKEMGDHIKRTEDVMWKSSDNSVSDSEPDLTVVRSKNMTVAAIDKQNVFRHSSHQEGLQPLQTDDDNQGQEGLDPRPTGGELSLSELSRTAYNLVPYVGRSQTLQKLLQLGVNLDRVQKVQGISEHLIKSDFKKDIAPYIRFLTILGVEVGLMGRVLTHHPRIFTQSLDDLEATVGYLLSKKFSLPEVASMVPRAPVLLLLSPAQMDEKLGFYQKTFDLSGGEVRRVALKHPRLLPWRREKIADVRFHVKEFLGFSDMEMKKILLKAPKVFMSNKHHLEKRFDYLHNTMLISHKQIVQWPSILRHRAHIVKQRHLFLLSLGLAQYDPLKENYVSMQALVTGSDQMFCENVAKTNFSDFVKFLRTL